MLASASSVGHTTKIKLLTNSPKVTDGRLSL